MSSIFYLFVELPTSIDIVGLIKLFEETDPSSFRDVALYKSNTYILLPDDVAIRGKVGVNANAKLGYEDLLVIKVTYGLCALPLVSGLYLSLVQTNT